MAACEMPDSSVSWLAKRLPLRGRGLTTGVLIGCRRQTTWMAATSAAMTWGDAWGGGVIVAHGANRNGGAGRVPAPFHRSAFTKTQAASFSAGGGPVAWTEAA